MARRLALLIGNQSFEEGSGFEPLRGPHNDVDALHAVLADDARGGFTEVRPIKDARHRDLGQEVMRVLREATLEDEVLIHYSGHGELDHKGRLFLAAADSRTEQLAMTALRASDLQEWMAESPARTVVLLLDCCFAGAFGKEVTGGIRGAAATSIREQLREMAASAQGRFILTSSTSTRTSLEAEGQADGIWMGKFTRTLIDRLNREAADAAEWVHFSDLSAHVASASAGQDPREFRSDTKGDPVIARALRRRSAEDHAQDVLAGFWHDGALDDAEFAAIAHIVAGDASDSRSRRFVTLLNAPGVTAKTLLLAWRRGASGPAPASQPIPRPVRHAEKAPEKEPFPPREALSRWREPVPGLPEAAWPDMVTLPADVFTMGAPKSEKDSLDDERPQREVTVPRPFALGRTAVTFAMWDAAREAGADLRGANDQGWGRDQRPVINVSWEDAQDYCVWLNQRLGLRVGMYRLPSEAEWEYACRAGTVTPFSFGETISPEQVNYDGNYTYGKARKGVYRERTVPVGDLPANAWGLRELHGNVWEWCEDGYGRYPNHATDSRPLIHADSSPRVLRGGSWYDNPRFCRSALRLWYQSGIRNAGAGFRLARTLF